ncbi:MAG: formate dehydrogenase, partial [Betaproteobacteria bacterium]
MTTKIYVPRDSSAIALGADRVAERVLEVIANDKLDAMLVRNGSRGMVWAEPLLEVETTEGRVGYANVDPTDV